ncbi:hypothetical protein BX666DRAFT_1951650 [Dichotomocladium elegans]|nr:hypothetical protein BX666DRAFT_1951650 [Dichotomocladium elegans]
MPIVVLTSSHISLLGMAGAVYHKCTDHYIHFSNSSAFISVVSPHGRVDPNLSTQSSTLSDNHCHGGERPEYVKAQRKKTRLRPSLYKDYLYPLIDVWPNHYYSNT